MCRPCQEPPLVIGRRYRISHAGRAVYAGPLVAADQGAPEARSVAIRVEQVLSKRDPVQQELQARPGDVLRLDEGGHPAGVRTLRVVSPDCGNPWRTVAWMILALGVLAIGVSLACLAMAA